MKKLEETWDIIVHTPYFTDAKTEVQGLESYIAAEQDCWVSVGKALCELCAAAEFPRVDQKVESGLHCNWPYRGLKESGLEHENLFL